MLVARLERQRRTDICKYAMEMRLRRIDVDMSERCGEMDFRL